MFESCLPFTACIRALQPVYVSRTNVNSRKKTIEEIKRRASSGGKWRHLVIFPEGTCTNRQCLITFKPGWSNVCLSQVHKLQEAGSVHTLLSPAKMGLCLFVCLFGFERDAFHSISPFT